MVHNLSDSGVGSARLSLRSMRCDSGLVRPSFSDSWSLDSNSMKLGRRSRSGSGASDGRSSAASRRSYGFGVSAEDSCSPMASAEVSRSSYGGDTSACSSMTLGSPIAVLNFGSMPFEPSRGILDLGLLEAACSETSGELAALIGRDAAAGALACQRRDALAASMPMAQQIRRRRQRKKPPVSAAASIIVREASAPASPPAIGRSMAVPEPTPPPPKQPSTSPRRPLAPVVSIRVHRGF